MQNPGNMVLVESIFSKNYRFR